MSLTAEEENRRISPFEEVILVLCASYVKEPNNFVKSHGPKYSDGIRCAAIERIYNLKVFSICKNANAEDCVAGRHLDTDFTDRKNLDAVCEFLAGKKIKFICFDYRHFPKEYCEDKLKKSALTLFLPLLAR